MTALRHRTVKIAEPKRPGCLAIGVWFGVMLATACSEASTAPEPVVNRAPVASAVAFASAAATDGPTALVPGTMGVGDTVIAAVAGLFSDPDGDALTYQATTSQPRVLHVSMRHDTLTVAALERGSADAHGEGQRSAGTVGLGELCRQSGRSGSGLLPRVCPNIPLRMRRLAIGRLGRCDWASTRMPSRSSSGRMSRACSRPRRNLGVEGWLRCPARTSCRKRNRRCSATTTSTASSSTRYGGRKATPWRSGCLRTIRTSPKCSRRDGLDSVEVVGRGAGYWDADWSASALRDVDVAVVLVNDRWTQRLVPSHVAPLRRFVERGGGLVIAGSWLHLALVDRGRLRAVHGQRIAPQRRHCMERGTPSTRLRPPP